MQQKRVRSFSEGLAAAVAATPDQKFVYVSNNVSGSVSVSATATNTVVATRPSSWQAFTHPAFANQGDCIQYVNSLP